MEPGGQITVVGENFPAGQEVEFRSNFEPIGSATADEDGNLYAEITISEDTEPGNYDLSAVFVDDEDRVASSGYAVVASDDDNDDNDGDDDAGDDEADADQEVTPNAPERYDNTVVIPETDGVTYQVDAEPVQAGTEIELTEDNPSLSVTAVADEGFVFDEDAETSWFFQWDPGFEDIFPIDPPEDWEADEDRWYSNVPETHLPDGYADWVLDYANSANRNAEGAQEFEADTQVYLRPSMDADTIGDAFPPDGVVWWGYLEDEDFWMIVHQYTGAAGFLPGESHLGEEPPVDGEASISVDSSEVEAGDEITVTGEGFEAGGEVTATGGGFEPGEDVVFEIIPELATVQADDSGVVTAVLTIPEDTEPGEYTLSATGAESGQAAEAALTVLASEGDGDDDGDDETVEPGLSVSHEEIELSDFVGDPEDGAGVDHSLVGLEAGTEIEYVVTGPDGLEDRVGTGVADDNGELDLHVNGPEVSDPSIYLGEYTTVVAFEDEDGELGELSASFTVVEDSDDGGTTPPADEDDDEDDDRSGDEGGSEDGDGSGGGSGSDDESTEGDDESTSPEDGDGESSGDAAPAGESSDDEDSEQLAKTGLDSAGIGLIAGLMLLLGGALAVFGYRGRFSRKA